MSQMTERGCRCGQVQMRLHKAPLVVAECHCTSCRAASERLQRLPDGQDVTAGNGGTPYVLYRKDRVEIIAGRGQLASFVLGPERTTRRVVATCCNTPMFLEFNGGHWLSLYRSLWPAEAAPALDLRTMVGDRVETTPLKGDVPAGALATTGFFARLLGAWIAMGFKVPKIDLGGRQIAVE
ncbi:GFA family protein [Devosia aquimaris]|uniref:GFA family protein n=1 Tax=Devosia aquimaris TaxID=2866214 RepID=UPI001CD15A0E|nr:hypothetical protein [Devosia sp. CJK-A8-3]